MRIFHRLCLIFLFFFFIPLSFAQEAAVQELLQLLEPIHSLKASFVQKILDNKGKVVETSEGKLALERPGRFRWEVFRPLPQLIIAHNNKIWIYDPDLEQLVIRPAAKELGQTPAFLLSNVNKTINKDFNVRPLSSPRNWQWFSLRPLAKDSMFYEIQLGFQNCEIKEIRMRDHLGHNTDIQLHELKMNVALAPSLFQLHPPAQVDVIDETR